MEGLNRYRYREEGTPGVGGPEPDELVFAYGAPPDHAFAGALDALCRVLP